MEINVKEDPHIVEIWLTRAEKQNPALRSDLHPIYKRFKEKEYLVAVYESGEKDLYEGTLDLLIYNKRRCTELSLKNGIQPQVQCNSPQMPV